jgi:hypothetical protein
MKSWRLQGSLNGGEVSPLLYGRPDLAKYESSLARCVNMIPLPQGGVTRRPGTRYVAAAKNASTTARLIPFVFSRKQAYMLEFGDEYVRFFMNGGQIYNITPNYTLLTEGGDTLITESSDTLVTEQTDPTAAPYEVASPYSAADLRELQYAQTADVMYIAHPDHPPRTLVRTGHTSWTFAELPYRNGPFLGYNITDNWTLQASAVSGTVTITSTIDIFDAGHVDALFLLEEDSSDGYSMWEPGKAYTTSDKVRWENNIYQCVTAGTSGAVAPVHIEGSRWDGKASGSAKWTYLHSGYGIAVITAVANAKSATALVLKRLPENVVSAPTKNWREGAWSPYQGWPRTVTLFEQRGWWAATELYPQTLWGSVAGDFTDFEPGGDDDDAIIWTINSRQANPISALVDGQNLHVLCESREMVGRASNNSAAVTPGDFTVRPSTSYGTAPVMPESIDTATVIVDASGRRVVELTFDAAEDNYVPFDLTLYAEHITRPGQ